MRHLPVQEESVWHLRRLTVCMGAETPTLACAAASLRAYSIMYLPPEGLPPPPFISPAESMRTDGRACGQVWYDD